MIKKLLFICLITVLLIGPVAAEQITMEVDSKRIEGMGTGHTPLDDNFCNIVYVISEREKGSYAHYIVQEYPITMKDYCKIKVGDIVTLESPEYDNDAWKVVSIQ